MDPIIKQQWTAALRSGEYQQGTSVLRRSRDAELPPQHCCLGVLCDLYLKANPGAGRWLEPISYKNALGTTPLALAGDTEVSHRSQYRTEILPPEIKEWAGLQVNNPGVNYKGQHKALSQLNDDAIFFEVLADLIDEQL